MLKGLFPFLLLIAAAATSKANSFDDCVLQYMGSAPNRDAVDSIERACINKTSTMVSLQIFSKAIGIAGYFNAGDGASRLGLSMKITNDTAYDITQITLIVTRKGTQDSKTYVLDSFSGPIQQGGIVTGLGKPSLMNVIRRGEIRQVLVPLDDLEATPSNFMQLYDWFPLGTKGVVNAAP